MPEHIGTVESAGMQVAKSGNKVFHTQLANPKWGYFCFDPAQQTVFEENLGKRVKVVYTENEKGRNVQSVEPYTEATESKSGGGNGHTSPEVWAEKDRRIARQAIAKSIIGVIGNDFGSMEYDWVVVLTYADFWFGWVYEIPPTPQSEPTAATKITEAIDSGRTIFHEADGTEVTRAESLASVVAYMKDVHSENMKDWVASTAGPRVAAAVTPKAIRSSHWEDDDIAKLYNQMRWEQENTEAPSEGG